jgi:hypothetical protein
LTLEFQAGICIFTTQLGGHTTPCSTWRFTLLSSLFSVRVHVRFPRSLRERETPNNEPGTEPETEHEQRRENKEA